MIPCCNDASSVDTSKWCNANLISLHFCAAFWEHFYSFSKCTAGTKEQKNILTLVLSHAKLQHVWSSQHPSVTLKCHHNYQQFIRNVDKKKHWNVANENTFLLLWSLEWILFTKYGWAMGDQTQKMCPSFLPPFIYIGRKRILLTTDN